MIAVCVSIDTEVDHRADSWHKSRPLTFRSVVEGVPHRLSPLFARHGARPTYLLTYEVMNDAASVEALARLRDAELGTHLHGDHVPPDARVPELAGAKSWDFNCAYPADLERAKLQTITERFRACFARAPRSYRAGRYGASGRTARLLVELGYRVDSSVTPGLRWRNDAQSAEVDFRRAPRAPYRPSAADLARPGELPLWEVPVTILRRPIAWDAAVGAYQAITRRPMRRYPVWLRPSTTSWPWLRWAAARLVRQAGAEPLTLCNIMFHSMEVVPAASPYARSESDAGRILTRLDRLLGFLAAAGARFFTLSELADLLDANQMP